MKQGDTVEYQPQLSLVVPLPIAESSLLALQETLQYLAALGKLPGDSPSGTDLFELLLVDGLAGTAISQASLAERPGAFAAIADGRNGHGEHPESLPFGLFTRVVSPALAAPGEASRTDALLAAISEASGRYVVVLDLQRPDDPVPTAETLASMMQAAPSADLVIASRYLPGAVGDSATYSQGLLADFRDWWPRFRTKVAVMRRFRRLASCTDLGSDCYLVNRALMSDLQVPETASDGSAPSLLFQVLVRCPWTSLTETPYRSMDTGASSLVSSEPAITRAALGSLKRGPRSKGPVRYRYQHLSPGPGDPEPLDDELPDVSSQPAGARQRRLLWTIGILALVLRIILLPIGHWWDLTVDYNTFIDLARNVSPYSTMQYLSHIAYASGWDYNYEYYAYPPVPLYIYYPLAHLYALLHPNAAYYIPVSGTYAIPDLSLDFFFLLKLPIWIADFAIAALLARMSGTIRGFRDYLLNPYVLLVSGAWTFDAIMVLGLLLSVYFLQRNKLASSGVALAFGTMVKFIPAVAAPAIVLYLIKKKRPVREIVLFLAAYGIACLVLLGPFWNGLLYVVQFEANRVPGGMNWQMYFRLSTFFPNNANLDPLSLAVGAFGTPTLVIVLLLAYWYCFVSRNMSLNRMILVSLLAFLLGSKLVNEQYALVVFPFLFLEARRFGGGWKWLARLFWIVPLLFAIVRVQIDRFLWLLYRDVWGAAAKAIAVTASTGFSGQFLPWSNLAEEHIITLVLGISFDVICLVAFFWPERRLIRPGHHLRAVESLDQVTFRDASVLETEADNGSAEAAPAIALQ